MAVKLIKEDNDSISVSDHSNNLVQILSHANSVIQALDKYFDMSKSRNFNDLYRAVSNAYDLALDFRDESEGK